MAIGSRRNRNGGYTFVDGRAVPVDQPLDAPVQDTFVPGRDQEAVVPGSKSAHAPGPNASSMLSSTRKTLREMDEADAFDLRDDVVSGGSFAGAASLMVDDRRHMRRLYIVFGLVLVVCFAMSCCVDTARIAFRSPVEVIQGLGTWVSLQFARVFDPTAVADLRVEAQASCPEYSAIAYQFGQTIRFGICGVMLAISGMLYQNAFRNPIAAPSMLGVTNGINFAILVLVMQFGYLAYEHLDLYYLYSYIAGVLVLVLVMLGGKWTSGKRKFNVVNMILIGTIVSQLLGVLQTYIQNTFLTDADLQAYTRLVNATDITNVWMYVTLVIGALVSLIPIFVFRFRLNLVSFSDEETKFLGVNPERLRLLALGCGSIMILTAQVNAGQVAMMSLVIPFVVRAVFGAEFRKQLGGNILVGAIMLIVCGVLANVIVVNAVKVGLGSISTLIALPLFVWMLAIRQRSWD